MWSKSGRASGDSDQHCFMIWMYSGGAAPGDTEGRHRGGGLRTFFIISDAPHSRKTLQTNSTFAKFFQILISYNTSSVLQGRVWDDVAVVTRFRQADRSWARRFAVTSPRFIGRRSASKVLSQDCLRRPILRLQLSSGPAMQAWRARWWSFPARGRLGRDVQWRTDDGCGQCLIRMAAKCGSVSRDYNTDFII